MSRLASLPEAVAGLLRKGLGRALAGDVMSVTGADGSTPRRLAAGPHLESFLLFAGDLPATDRDAAWSLRSTGQWHVQVLDDDTGEAVGYLRVELDALTRTRARIVELGGRGLATAMQDALAFAAAHAAFDEDGWTPSLIIVPDRALHALVFARGTHDVVFLPVAAPLGPPSLSAPGIFAGRAFLEVLRNAEPVTADPEPARP